MTTWRYSADPLLVNGEALGMHCKVQPDGVGCLWYSAMAAMHCSRLSKLPGKIAMPPCGPAITRYQINAAVEAMVFPRCKRSYKSGRLDRFMTVAGMS
ncbi:MULTISPECIES: hypothetical protein [unclassified Mesorhizobium]|uniref:hypothetical protein n=1 Tax=unclassified Mesorhizobium TaxID=325217 RepID=UPI0015CD27D3|nr:MULTISPECIES: hypothetical protein [unclassified Mesorhizobium]